MFGILPKLVADIAPICDKLVELYTRFNKWEPSTSWQNVERKKTLNVE